MHDGNGPERRPILRYCLWAALALSLAVNLFLLTATRSRGIKDDQIPIVAPPISAVSSWDMIWGEGMYNDWATMQLIAKSDLAVPTKDVTWQSFSPYSEPGEAASQLWYDLLSRKFSVIDSLSLCTSS